MRRLILLTALAATAALPAGAPAATASSWPAQADTVCVVWVAKAKKMFATPVKPTELYGFAVKAKTLESQELAALVKLPGASPAGARALDVMRSDIAEVGSAIAAWDKGDKAGFVQILKQYLNDHRAKAAFAAAGATRCG